MSQSNLFSIHPARLNTGLITAKYRIIKLASTTVLAIITLACDSALKPDKSIEVAAKGSHSGALSANGKLAVIGSIHHGASLWDINTQARLYTWNHQPDRPVTATSVDISDNNQLALTVQQYTLVLWDNQTGQGIRHWRTPAQILDAKLSAQGQYALLGLADNRAVLFDIQNGGIARELNHDDRVNSVNIATNGTLALTGSDDNRAIIWDLTRGQKKHILQHDDNVIMTALSHDSRLAFTMSQYDKAAVWHTDTGEPIGELSLKAEGLKRGLRYTAATFNTDNTQLLTGRPDQIVELWDIPSLTRVAKWKLPKRDKWKPTGAAVQAVRFISNTEFAAIASNGFVHTLTLPKP